MTLFEVALELWEIIKKYKTREPDEHIQKIEEQIDLIENARKNGVDILNSEVPENDSTKQEATLVLARMFIASSAQSKETWHLEKDLHTPLPKNLCTTFHDPLN